MLCCLLLVITCRRVRRVMALLALSLATLAANRIEAAEAVTIELVSGRTFSGQVDPRTTHEQLWLRFTKGRIVIRRPFAWDQVGYAELAGEAISLPDLRTRLLGEQPAATEPGAGNLGCRFGSTDLELRSHRPCRRSYELARPKPPKFFDPVCSINIEAAVANWDADVENDGILVYVRPLDCTGSMVPAAGTLEVELVGEGPGNPSLPETFPTLGRWAQMLRADELTPRGYVFRLPFQAIHPEFNLQVGPAGLVHAQLAVPGRGVFEATTNTISVRPINPFRDRLQVQQNSRFLPTERTGQSVQPTTVVP